MEEKIIIVQVFEGDEEAGLKSVQILQEKMGEEYRILPAVIKRP
jgi:hypothetical protein